MTNWTDTELGDLLRETFAAHEDSADPHRAARVVAGTRTPKRRWVPVLAAAAAVVLAVGTAVALTRDADHRSTGTPVATQSPASPAPSPSAPSRTDADNWRAAQQESRRVLGLAPFPAPASRLKGQPASWPCCGMSLGPSDPRLTRTAWFSVPLDADQVENYLVTHVPAGMRLDDYEPGEPHSGVGGGPDGVRDLSYSTRFAPTGVAGTALLVQWRDMGSYTALRFDTFLSARLVRAPESYVTGPVSSVEVSRTTERVQGMHSPPNADVVITSPTAAGSLAERVNALDASTASNREGLSCPFSPRTTYTVRFTTSAGTLSFEVSPSCWDQVAVTADGTAVLPTLDPGKLVPLLDDLLKQK